jgi:7-keto-8-aminopelargonate synthetase-like enzyme
MVDLLINRARSFIYSTAPVPAAAAAATAAIGLVQSRTGRELCATLWERVARLHTALHDAASTVDSAIMPVALGDETAAVDAAACLLRHGYYVPAIRYPTVARGSARLRITCTAAHTNEQVTELSARVKPWIANRQSPTANRQQPTANSQ